jgi:pimeloyl-ACP methyl ester carboxylesterase
LHQYYLSLNFRDAHLSTGVRLNYAQQGDSSGHPIIFLHGYTDSWFSFSPVLAHVASTYNAYALDQRGHGDSDRPVEGYSMLDLSADVVAFMDAMGIGRATVVGHSMGSLVAQQLALTAPQRLARLILIGSGTCLRSEALIELKQAVDMLEDPVPKEFARDFQASTIYHPVPDDFLEQVIAESLKLPARVWRAALEGQLAVDYTGQLSHLQIPTLIMRGDNDTIFTRAAQNSLESGIANPVLKVYEETGHALHWERPEEFARDFEEFITNT